MAGKGELRRQQIVDTALREAGAVGLEGITLGVLAEHLKISKSGLFAHFQSKEDLQCAVLEEAIQRFVAVVVRPALAEPAGEPRVAALWQGWQRWISGTAGAPAKESGAVRQRGCFFMSLATEYDDRPGPVRDALVRSQEDWLKVLARAARVAVAEGHFRADLDAEFFAYEFIGVGMTLQYALKLVGDPKADARAAQAFAGLLERSRAPRPSPRSRRAKPAVTSRT